jgi:hypothetical protein
MDYNTHIRFLFHEIKENVNDEEECKQCYNMLKDLINMKNILCPERTINILIQKKEEALIELRSKYQNADHIMDTILACAGYNEQSTSYDNHFNTSNLTSALNSIDTSNVSDENQELQNKDREIHHLNARIQILKYHLENARKCISVAGNILSKHAINE